MRLRSPLFAPGDSEHKITKALASDADAVILDLEDSVVPSEKDAARALVAARLPAIARPGVIVRVNAEGTPWHLADLAAIVPGRPAALLLPKCAEPEVLHRLDERLCALEASAGIALRTIGVLAIAAETVASVQTLSRYAPGIPRLLGLGFGAEDLAADLGIAPRDAQGRYAAPIFTARSLLVIAANASGVLAIDTPAPDPHDLDAFTREAIRAREDGFSGKFLIHPAQIAPAHKVFTPSAEQVGWARAVLAAFAANPNAGALALDGRMIDQPHRKLAERILAIAG